MKKVFVHAYLNVNLGDDLMVWILCKRYPDVRFQLLTETKYREVFSELSNVKIYSVSSKTVRFWDWFWKKSRNVNQGFWKMLVRFSDATIHIGGSSFVQHYDDYSAFLNTDVTLRRLSKKMIAIGMNFGPYADENYYRQYYELLGKYDGVTFRDTVSYQLFQELPNVKKAADVVFNYKNETVVSQNVKKQVLISVIQMRGRNGKYAISQYDCEYKKFMAKVAEAFIDKGYEVKFLSLCERQGDADAIREISDIIMDENKGRISQYNYQGNIEECVHIFEESEIVVGTRFHSIVLGWLKEKRVLPIIYDEKTQNVLDDVEYPVYIGLDDLDKINLEDILENIPKMESEQVKKLVSEAEKQFWASDIALDYM